MRAWYWNPGPRDLVSQRCDKSLDKDTSSEELKLVVLDLNGGSADWASV